MCIESEKNSVSHLERLPRGGVTWLPPSLRSLARCGVRIIPAIAIGGAGEVLEEHDDGAQQAAGQGGGHGWAKRPLWTAMNL